MDKEIRLVLLLHDVGKPHSYQDDDNKIRHFKGHSSKSAEISKPILERLGYSKEEIDEMIFLIENHDKPIQMQDINNGNIDRYKKLLYIEYCDASGYNPEYIKRVYDRLYGIFLQLENYKENNLKNTDDISV
jgi:tRNA nucleotidyltransferase (CCA-adding enzyme)